MNKYYHVSFEWSEGIYCTNIAVANNEEAVVKHYDEYSWKSIREANQWEVETAKQKGMPIINCNK